jgi:hypothetical protein
MKLGSVVGVVGLVAAGALTGCSSEVSYTVGATKLVVKDALYRSRPTGYYCNGLASNQLKIELLDFAPACPVDRMPGEPDPFDPNVQHASLELILALGGNPTYKRDPFVFDAETTCDGGGANSYAFFKRLAPMAQLPETTNATSGSIQLTAFDPADPNKPAEGTFTLDFMGTKVAGSFKAFSCNQ